LIIGGHNGAIGLEIAQIGVASLYFLFGAVFSIPHLLVKCSRFCGFVLASVILKMVYVANFLAGERERRWPKILTCIRSIFAGF